jgi:hypothetical protein
MHGPPTGFATGLALGVIKVIAVSNEESSKVVKIKVYQFKVWDNAMGRWMLDPFKRPMERIKEIPRSEIIHGTEEEIDASELDEHGRSPPSSNTPARG